MPPAFGSGDQERRPVGRQQQVHGNHGAAARLALGHQERVAGRPQREIAAVGDLRRAGVESLRERGAREREVERAQPLHQERELGQARVDLRGQLGQEPQLLVPLFQAPLGDLVVELDHLLGLDEERGAAPRAVVHDAPHRPARVAAHRKDGAAVPDGDVALLEGGGDVGAIEQAGEPRLDLAAQGLQLTADGAQARAGAVQQAPVGIELVVDRRRQRLAGGHRPAAVGDPRRDGRDRAAVGGQARRRAERPAQGDQGGAVERRPLGHRSREGRPDIGDPVPGRGPSAVSARRASLVSASAAWTTARSPAGVRAPARSRP